jgi:hypothetical protein
MRKFKVGLFIFLTITSIFITYQIGFFNGQQKVLPSKVLQENYLNGYRQGWFAGKKFMGEYTWDRYKHCQEELRKSKQIQ